MALYYSDQRGVTRAVILPLRDGLSAFNCLYDSLLRVNDPFQNMVGSGNIRGLIVRSEQDMRRAEDQAKTGLIELDQETENLTAQLKSSRRERDGKILFRNNLQTKLAEEKQSLKTSKRALKQARDSVQEQKEVLEQQRGRETKAAVVTGVGIGVTVIPVLGWIAGPIMAIGGAIEMDEAEKAISVAKEEVEEAESKVEKYTHKVSDYQSKISQTDRDIRRADKDLRRIKEKLTEIPRQRQALSEFQQKMRDAVRLLGHLSGSAHVLEVQTRRSILLEPVMKLLEEVVESAGRVAGHQLLRDEGVLSIAEDLRDRNRSLTALCASHNTPALQNYI